VLGENARVSNLLSATLTVLGNQAINLGLLGSKNVALAREYDRQRAEREVQASLADERRTATELQMIVRG
jgi:ABC-type uncharacterized transport system permease subunit